MKSISRQQLQTVLLHFGNPVYVDLKPEDATVRFATKDCLNSFLAKATDSSISANQSFLSALNVQLHSTPHSNKVEFAVLNEEEVN
jgi:hypothetical protein